MLSAERTNIFFGRRDRQHEMLAIGTKLSERLMHTFYVVIVGEGIPAVLPSHLVAVLPKVLSVFLYCIGNIALRFASSSGNFIAD